jgi:hypothetical protein
VRNSPEGQAWRWLGRASNALTVGSVGGAIVIAAAIGAWARVKHLPGPEIVVLILVACAAVLGIVAASIYVAGKLRESSQRQSPGPAAPTTVSQPPSQLEVQFSATTPYTYFDGKINRYRIGVYNPGSTTVDQVRRELVSMLPLPQSGTFSADFPYPVRRATDPEPKQYARINAEGKPLSPGSEELFEALAFWKSSDGRVIVDGLDTKPIQWDGKFEMHEHESWVARYRISSGAASPQIAVFAIRREGGGVLMEYVRI